MAKKNQIPTQQGKNQTSVSQMKTKPLSAIGKRGLCAEGVSNTVNKCVRSAEDIVNAIGMGYPLTDTPEGRALVKANIAMLQGASDIITAYTALEATKTTDLDIITSSRIGTNILGNIAILQQFLA